MSNHHRPHRHSSHAQTHHYAPRPMSRRVRNIVMYGASALWLSGAIWMVLHYFFSAVTEFGVTPNAWEPFTIRIHGALAMLMLFMFGWIGGTHVAVRWRQWRANLDGLVLLVVTTLLVVSGYSLYYLVDDSQRHVVSLIHQVIGGVIVFVAIIHWSKARTNSR